MLSPNPVLQGLSTSVSTENTRELKGALCTVHAPCGISSLSHSPKTPPSQLGYGGAKQQDECFRKPQAVVYRVSIS